MRKKLLTVSALLLAMGEPAFAAGYIPGFTSLPGLGGGVPNSALDYTFDQSGLTGSFTGNGSGNWTLAVSGTGASALYTPSASSTFTTINPSTYSLTAQFSGAGAFEGGTLSISTTANATTTTLLTENLTGFGYSAAQAAIGFTTQFTGGTYDAPQFTGGSTGDVTYLFTQGGVGTGFSPLSGIIHGFASGTLQAGAFANIESLAAVPLPMPAVLFGTGLAALIGYGRKRRLSVEK